MTQEEFWAALDDYFENGTALDAEEIMEYTDGFNVYDEFAEKYAGRWHSWCLAIYAYRDKWVGFEVGIPLTEDQELEPDFNPLILHREKKRKVVEEVKWIDSNGEILAQEIV